MSNCETLNELVAVLEQSCESAGEAMTAVAYEIVAADIVNAGFRKPRVDRSQLIEKIRAAAIAYQMLGTSEKTMGSASFIADSILSMISAPEVETPDGK